MNDLFTFKNREEVPEKYTWDLTTKYKSTKDWELDFNNLKNEINSISKYKNNLVDNADNLYNCLELDTNISTKLEKLYVYAYLKHDEDLTNPENTKMFMTIYSLYVEYSKLTSFISPTILKVDNKTILDFMKENKKLNKYKRVLDEIRRYKKYTLSEKIEKIIATLNSANNAQEVTESLLDSEIKYGSIKVDNKNMELTNANYSKFSRSKDRNIRKQASLKRNKSLKQFQNTFALNLTSCLKDINNTCKVRSYDNYFQATMFADKIPKNIYHSLLKFVNNNLHTFQRLIEIRKKCLKLDTVYNYDLGVELIPKYDHIYTIEEAQDLVTNATKILGSEYNEIIKKIFQEKWIDYCSYKGKKSGGYQISSYLDNPNILMHYQGKLGDISTIAHESGHAVHSYLSNKYNDELNAEYTIFIAEIASLTNEILLSNYIKKNSNNKKEKLSSIYNLIETISDNFYGASLQAEFEYEVSKRIINEEEISYQELNEIFSNLQKKYYGKNLKFSKNSEINWCRITHFFSPFYTYKYATGVTCACYVASNIENEEYKEKYLNFLKSGCKKDSLELLEDINIDLTKEETFEHTVKLLNDLMDEFEELYKEVNDE
ncbi:MAG TPA: oligoendopeptidase F [Bacilli bacterium]|jgi:oligoendopeptidase F|nr:oligoendopeptidase F [Bacilli bacterium]